MRRWGNLANNRDKTVFALAANINDEPVDVESLMFYTLKMGKRVIVGGVAGPSRY